MKCLIKITSTVHSSYLIHRYIDLRGGKVAHGRNRPQCDRPPSGAYTPMLIAVGWSTGFPTNNNKRMYGTHLSSWSVCMNTSLIRKAIHTFINFSSEAISRSSQCSTTGILNKGRGMCYPVCGMVHIKEPLLLIDKSSLSEWSLTICLTPYNRR